VAAALLDDAILFHAHLPAPLANINECYRPAIPELLHRLNHLLRQFLCLYNSDTQTVLGRTQLLLPHQATEENDFAHLLYRWAIVSDSYLPSMM
jgi:hypothetical protein